MKLVRSTRDASGYVYRVFAKGYCFVRETKENQNTFLHFSDFATGQPMVGDIVDFQLNEKANGEYAAENAKRSDGGNTQA